VSFRAKREISRATAEISRFARNDTKSYLFARKKIASAAKKTTKKNNPISAMRNGSSGGDV